MSEAASPRLFGARVRRVEDPRLLRGEGRYLGDLRRPGLLQAAFLRSPHAHARIRLVDLAAARALPGVRLVLDGAMLVGLARPFRIPLRSARYWSVDQPLLAVGKVRYVGEPVALVVADDAYLARDALEAIEVEYEPLPAVVEARAGLADGAAQLHDGAPNNLLFEDRHEVGNVAAAFAVADLVVEGSFYHARCTSLALESRGVLAEPRADGRLAIWSSTQAPYGVRNAVATSLGLEPDQVVVATPDIGGGFGAKAQVYPEEVLVPLAARLLGGPVAWTADRQEDLTSSTQARDQRVEAALAARADGTLLGLRAEVFCDVGAYGCYPYGPALEALGTPAMLPGPYRVPSYAFTSRAVATNKPPQGAYRGVGIVVAAFVHERLMDLLAARLGLDPAEVRRRNLLPPQALPYQSAGGMLYDSGSFGASLELALAAADYAALRQQQAAARQAGRLLGIGLCSYVEYTGMGSAVYRARGMDLVDGRESASLRLDADGRVQVVLSLPSQGQGLATTFGQLVADELGLPLEQVVVGPTATDQTPVGSGTFASRSAVVGGSAVQRACTTLKERLLGLAADLLETAPADLELRQGEAAVRGAAGRRLGLAELAAAAERRGEPLAAAEPYDPPGTTFANATHLAVVEVDRATGRVEVLRYVVAEDCGRLINPTIVDGQIQGAVAQGLGGALLEELRYDPSGQLLSASLADYLVPAAADLPSLEIHHLESPAPNSLIGVKGVGEGGTVGAAAALANAVADALDRPVWELPMTPERILRALRQA